MKMPFTVQTTGKSFKKWK